MRVLIDTTYVRRAPFSGTAIYLERLGQALSRIEGIDLLEVANARRRAPAGGGMGSVRNLAVDLGWTIVELPRLARRHRADILHHPLPAISPGPPQAITVHDLSFERVPECFDRGFRTYAHHAHRNAARRAGAVICVSHTTAADVRERWSVDAEKIVVAPHGPGQLDLAFAARQARHFLYVGDAEPRKDLPTLMAAYELYRRAASSSGLPPVPLVLAGSASARAEGVEVHSNPPPDRLAELYAGALALVHPSLYEGFGLTALEAMRVGVPVLAAHSPGLIEVCGDAALYAEPGRAQSFAAQMGRLASEPRLRDEVSARGSQRAEEFSWEISAQAHVRAYRLAAVR